MTKVHLVLPAGYDDPRQLSGGNIYDREISAGLTELGWTVVGHEVADAWPAPGPTIVSAVDRELAHIPTDKVVVVDGLLGAAAEMALVKHADRLRLVALAHMPDPPGGPPEAVLRAVRLVVATSSWTARTLIERYGIPTDKMIVAPPGAPDAEMTVGTATGTALLCVAAVTEQKGHDILFTALARLPSYPWTCVCVGALDREPGFVRGLRQVLSDSGISDRVHLTGALIGPDLERAYAAADVLVLPTRLESYGMVVTEALAHGLPVIATSVGGVPEAVGYTADGRRPGIMVEPDDAGALGAAIADWLGQPKVRDDLRSAARSRRSTLCGWEQTTTMISAALTRLAAT